MSTSISNTFEIRRDRLFGLLAGLPLHEEPIKPPYEPGRPIQPRDYSYSIINFAMKAFYLDERPYFALANQKLCENARLYIENPVLRDDRDSFYWSMDLLCRIVEFFGRHGSMAAGRLSAESEELIYDSMFLWAKNNSLLEMAEFEKSHTWHVWESENHHVQRFSAAWHISRLLSASARYAEQAYDDGGTPAAHYQAWTAYICEWLCERARKSLFIETGNSFYGLHTLKGIYNFYDFAGNPELKRLAQYLLDLYWATWAEEQLDGVRGGGKSRVYPGKNSLLGKDPFRRLAWCYLGMGTMETPNENELTVLTSAYRLPPVVADLALDGVGRGTYEIRQRPLGLASGGYFRNPDYRLNTEWGGIYRYSYCTPGFILGSLMYDARPYEEWTLISSQNRWQGAIFRGHLDARIVVQCRTADYTHPEVQVKRAYNQHWSAQRKGTLISQKLQTSHVTAGMRVWFSEAGLSAPLTIDNWTFVEAQEAYAAVRVAAGGFEWESEAGFAGRWLVCEDELSPVILEVGLKQVFGSFADFQVRVLANPVELKAGCLVYQSIYGDTFEFFSDFSHSPHINGQPAVEIPGMAFESPFVQAAWDSGVVTIQKGGRRYEMNFNRKDLQG
jgi:hypothetical protein